MKNKKGFFFLHIGGFSIGFAASIILALFIYIEYSVDKGYPNYQNIYRLIDAKKNSSKMDYDIAKSIKDQFSEIRYASPLVYLSWGTSTLKSVGSEDHTQIEGMISTTNEFFKIFSVSTIHSKSEEPLADLNSVVITESLAQRLFGRTDVLDEILSFYNRFELPISAVIKNLPENSSFSAEVFLNTENEKFRFSSTCSDKCYNPLDQYVYLNQDADIGQLTKKMNAEFPFNKSDTDSIRFQALADIYLASDIEGNRNKAGSKGLLTIFLSIAIIILLMTAINYVNFSLSNQLATLKELGIKITNGADRTFLRSFYITEVSLSVIISFVIALLISLLALPLAQDILGTSLELKWLLRPELMLVFSLALLTIILISSSAPLFIISRYDVQKLFGKKHIQLGKQPGKKALTVFQIAASIILLICLVSMQKQLTYVKTTNLGFDKELLLRLNIPKDLDNYNALKQQFEALSFVKNISLSNGGPGFIHLSMGTRSTDGEDFMLDCIYIDDDFLSVFDIPLTKGNKFLGADKGVSCYINETALKKYGWDNIEGKKFHEAGYKVVGVVSDFHVASLHNTITPVCLIYNSEYSEYNTINIKLLPGNLGQQMKQIKEVWKSTLPEASFSYQFYDEYFDSLYKNEDRQGKAIALFSLITLIITCIGILGQIAQTCVARIKEIGIRKVNGAKIYEVMIMLNKDIVKWVSIAFVIACPFAWYAMDHWLQNFAYKTELSWWIFALAGLLTLGIALLTVSWQSWQAARRNPVESLRYE